MAQEITYQLWKSFDTFQQKSSLSTWIYRVAMNVAIYHLKVGKRKIQEVPLNERIMNFEDINDRREVCDSDIPHDGEPTAVQGLLDNFVRPEGGREANGD